MENTTGTLSSNQASSSHQTPPQQRASEVIDEIPMLVYGTLRRDVKRGYNYGRFGPQHYVKTMTIHGFNMHSLGAYPCVCDGAGAIEVELHMVNKRVFDGIKAMEEGAGYFTKERLLDDGTKAFIFVWPRSRAEEFDLIPTGKWN